MNFYLFVFFVSTLSLVTSARTGVAIFNNTETGLNGTVSLRTNPVFGTYLIGQIRNIVCHNTTSAKRIRATVPSSVTTNNCIVGVTINNWRQSTPDTKDSTYRALEWTERQTIFNLSNIRFPDNIRNILSGNFKPIQHILNPTATTAPVVDDRIKFANGTCADVGEVFNPNRDMWSGPLGLVSPPGILGNLVVSNGTGTIMMGPLELMTAGRPSVIGLPLVIWMDSIRPEVNGTTILLKTGPTDRVLDCAIIQATSS